jgi:DNA-binding MarR family transcriptional regulator
MSTDLEIAVGLNSAVTRLGRRIRRIDDRQEIGRARLSALSVLVFGGPCSMSDLATAEMVSPATMHHVVNGLLELNFAQRAPDERDARRFIVSATRQGRRFMEEARQARLDFYRSRLRGLSAEQKRAVETFAQLALGWID